MFFFHDDERGLGRATGALSLHPQSEVESLWGGDSIQCGTGCQIGSRTSDRFDEQGNGCLGETKSYSTATAQNWASYSLLQHCYSRLQPPIATLQPPRHRRCHFHSFTSHSLFDIQPYVLHKPLFQQGTPSLRSGALLLLCSQTIMSDSCRPQQGCCEKQ